VPLTAVGRLTETQLPWPWIAAGAAATLPGLIYGARVRGPVAFAIAALVLVGIMIGIGR